MTDFLDEPLNTRSRVLMTAEKLVNGDRNAQYGPPEQDFQRTADIWTALIAHKLHPGERIEAHEVASFMIGLKLSRIVHSPLKEDSWTDAAGYAACGFDTAVRIQGEPDGDN